MRGPSTMEGASYKAHFHLPWRNRRGPSPSDQQQKSRKEAARESLHHQHMRLLNMFPLKIKNRSCIPDIVAATSEFAGTFMFLLFAFGGTNAVNVGPPRAGDALPADLGSDPARLQFIALAFGMSLAVNAWVFFRVSGGLFNPAVALAMVLVGSVGYVRGLLVVLAQIVGAIAAAAVVAGLTPGPLKVGTALAGGTSVVRGLFIEMFLTAQLVFAIFMLASEKHRATFIAPVGIGLSLFIAEMMGVYYTGGSLNPARSFGPAVVTGEFPGYHWIYWAGPLLGSLLATGFYVLIKALEYETVNPGQDEPGDAPLEDLRKASSVTATATTTSHHHHQPLDSAGRPRDGEGAAPALPGDAGAPSPSYERERERRRSSVVDGTPESFSAGPELEAAAARD